MRALAICCLLAIALPGCVGAKKFRAERQKRVVAEARDSVLTQENTSRKNEVAALTDRTEELAKTVGRLQLELEQAKALVGSQSASAQASTSKLLEEKSRLEKELSEKKKALAERDDLLRRIAEANRLRDSTLQAIRDEVAVKFNDGGIISVYAEPFEGNSVRLTLPDRLLFDEKGLTLNESGLPALQIVGDFLAAHPGLQTAIVAHTDNVIPKEKGVTIRDSRDWSLLRANVVGRVLAREFNVNDNQLSFVGRGEFFPVASNETPEGRAENRRTELFFYPKLAEIPRK